MTLPEIDSDAVLRTFLSLARLDSPSGAEGPVRDYLAQRLDALGVCHRTDATGNLIAEIPPSRCPHPVVLVVCAHMDVVPPCLGVQPQVCGEGDARWIQSDGTTVLGADDKAALAPILEALECSLACAAPRPAVRLIFTVEEETHLKGARQLDDDALRAGFAITFDHTGPPGTLIQRAPFLTTFEITVRGRAAHAGIAPEEGLNAIVLAARVVTRLRQGRLEGETTANIGRIEGGKATNIVPDCVLISGEIRSYRPEAIQDELDCIERVLREETASMPGTSFLLTRERAFDGYAHAPDSPAIQRLTHIIESQGLTPAVIASHGGSDNNVFMTRGLAGVVLSAAMEAPHTVNERAHLTDMMQTARLLLAFGRILPVNPSELRQIAIRPHSMADVRKLLEQGPTETRVSSTVRCRGRVVTMREDQARLPDGAIRPRDVLEHPGGMVMLPILDDGCVVMIRQFRYALGHALIELPAGKLDPGETPLEGAYRELAEETGYCAEKMDEITFIYTSPGFCNERLWLFRATGLKPLDHVATGDDEEYLRPLILTPAQVREAIDQRLIVDAKSICLLSLGL